MMVWFAVTTNQCITISIGSLSFHTLCNNVCSLLQPMSVQCTLRTTNDSLSFLKTILVVHLQGLAFHG